MVRLPQGCRVLLSPSLEQTEEIVSYFNRNLHRGAFPLIATDFEFTPDDAHDWFVMQKSGRHIRAAALDKDENVVGAGYLNRGVGKKSHTARIAVTVDLDNRNQGIGTAIFSCLISEAKKQGIMRIEDEPVSTNAPAVHILEKLGFKQEGIARRKVRLDNGDLGDCLHMVLILGESGG